jgi:endonuclease/exonuclease/phosphatase family metal-dependent hydrolase
MILFAILLLGYYAVYQITLPYSNSVLEIIAAAILAIAAIVFSIKPYKPIQLNKNSWLVPGLAALLMILPLVNILSWHEKGMVQGTGFPVRVMTYNLHNGFNTDGDLDIEALAKIIEENNPDIVALQEVSRGWVISGSVDMLTWLSNRLDMPYVSGPTADQLWGNAILSRYTIVNSDNYDLSPRDSFILRGFTATVFEIGQGIQLQVIATHFHHLEEGSDIRQVQSQEIVSFWNQNDLTVIMGDFNAEYDTPEIESLIKAGLVDTITGEDSSTIYTFHSAQLHERIDYIWISPDLNVADSFVPFSKASDHLPVVADIYH